MKKNWPDGKLILLSSEDLRLLEGLRSSGDTIQLTGDSDVSPRWSTEKFGAPIGLQPETGKWMISRENPGEMGRVNAPGGTRAYLASINNGLSKLPPYEGVVFRGGALSGNIFARYVPGLVLCEKGFLSATRDAHACFIGDTLYVIQSRSSKDLTSLAEDPAEQEHVFTFNTRFIVLGSETRAGTPAGIRGRQVIWLREMGPVEEYRLASTKMGAPETPSAPRPLLDWFLRLVGK